jgi:hypothetical protein
VDRRPPSSSQVIPYDGESFHVKGKRRDEELPGA